MNREQTFEEFKNTWLNSEITSHLEWTAHGDNYQRDFYVFDGTQITVNTCFPYAFGKPNSVYFWVDCIVEKNKDNKRLVKNYKGILNDWAIYAEEQNVAMLQFNKEDDMIRFMYENDYKSLQVSVTLY